MSNSRYTIYKSFKSVKDKVEAIPFFGNYLKKSLISIKNLGVKVYVFYITRIKFSLATKFRLTNTEDYNNLFVSPEDINYLSHLDQKIGENSEIIGGNWDEPDHLLNDLAEYTFLHNSLTGGMDWKNTAFYKEALTCIENGQEFLSCNTIAELNTRFQNLQNLITSINSKEVNSRIIDESDLLGDQITVDIGRHGDLLCAGGKLRLAAAKLLQVETIQAKVRARHTDWARFKKRFEILSTDVGSRSYQPLLHPDLSHIPASQSSAERLAIIKQNMTRKEGRLLDLGANMGYFSIHFENAGFDCTAVENYPLYVYCLKGQKRALHKNFKIITDSILDSKEILKTEYDVVLALNIFFHFFYEKETFEIFVTFLENLVCKEIYFEPHLHTDPQLVNAYINMHEDEFVEFVRTKLRLTKVELIGTASDKRHLYKIS